MPATPCYPLLPSATPPPWPGSYPPPVSEKLGECHKTTQIKKMEDDELELTCPHTHTHTHTHVKLASLVVS